MQFNHTELMNWLVVNYTEVMCWWYLDDTVHPRMYTEQYKILLVKLIKFFLKIAAVRQSK